MIGETLYLHDGNRRRYVKDEHGKSVMDRASCYIPVEIVGETPKSWIAMHYGREIKINKKDLSTASLGVAYSRYAYTAQQVEDRLWRENNQHDLVNAIRDCQDVQKLRQIAAILGIE